MAMRSQGYPFLYYACTEFTAFYLSLSFFFCHKSTTDTMLFLFLTLAFAKTATAIPAAAASSVLPNPSQVSINGIVYGGTGCPQGSLGSFISADRQTYVLSPYSTRADGGTLLTLNLRFTLIFDDYVASIGPGVGITENRKNCQLNINLEYPSGFQYSVFSQVYRGYVELDAGVSALQEATYYFSGGTASLLAPLLMAPLTIGRNCTNKYLNFLGRPNKR